MRWLLVCCLLVRLVRVLLRCVVLRWLVLGCLVLRCVVLRCVVLRCGGLLAGREDPGHVVPDRAGVERPGRAQGPGERSPGLGEGDAPRVEVHRGAATRQAPGGVGDQQLPDRDDTQQIGPSRPGPAAHAGAHRARAADR